MTTTKTNTEKNLEKEIDYKALYIQTLADYQNLQRRSLEEKRAIAKQASNDMLLKILHIYHSAKAGLKYNEKGAFLLYNAFVKFLNENDIGIINTDFFADKTDNKFSEDWAVAISIKSPEEDNLFPEMNDEELDNRIYSVVEDGFYNIKTGKVISYAKVIVYKVN